MTSSTILLLASFLAKMSIRKGSLFLVVIQLYDALALHLQSGRI
uniref:Uncharacterized protein n=1 Tax=Arundo donax TaxID=35708 RepID=A0A0A9H1Z8_ARUDO